MVAASQTDELFGKNSQFLESEEEHSYDEDEGNEQFKIESSSSTNTLASRIMEEGRECGAGLTAASSEKKKKPLSMQTLLGCTEFISQRTNNLIFFWQLQLPVGRQGRSLVRKMWRESVLIRTTDLHRIFGKK